MTLKEMIDALLFRVSQWAGVTLPLIVTLLVGLTACVAAVTALWTRRIRVVPALLLLLAGTFLVMISLDTRILHWLVETSYLVRIRLVMGVLSLLVVGVTFEAVRRSRLKERYAILWMFTGLIILLCAFFPAILDFLTALLGLQYVTAVGVVMFAFFLMVLFHVSLALSNIQEDETATAQRCALLEARVEQLAAELAVLRGGRPASPEPAPVLLRTPAAGGDCGRGRRTLRGFVVGVPVLIAATALAVLWTGLRAPQAMVGDEVTHYYMLIHQAQMLPEATFDAEIPTGWGARDVRGYPHTNLWHYAGACLYRWFPSFALIQVYQAFFLVQFLAAGFFLIRRRRNASTPAILLYLLLLASLPVTLMFSVTFYQDVPVAAQLVTAFCLLDRRRWAWAALFMMAALGIKETAFLFVPPFVVMLALQRWQGAGRDSAASFRRLRAAGPVVLACVMLWLPMQLSDQVLQRHHKGGYYPFKQMKSLAGQVPLLNKIPYFTPPLISQTVAMALQKGGPISPRGEVIANHPGDLRQPANWVLYGGILMWLVMGLGAARRVIAWREPVDGRRSLANQWPLWVGLAYVVPAAWMLKGTPDARFFLPAVPFVLVPFVESFARLPRQRVWMSLWVALAIVQSGFVLSKAVQLRQVTPELKACIAYLERNPPPHNRVFMYPEGNYRLFPAEHDWYLKYRLREFWRGSNDFRLQLLVKRKVGAIVVKKNLVSPVDRDITNLGVYPDYFVKQIEADARFRKVFDNAAASIYEFDASGLPLLD